MARAVSSVGINTGTKSSSGRKGLFVRHTVPHHCPSLRGIRMGTQTGQAHGGGNRCRSPGGVLLMDSLVMAGLLAYIIEGGTHYVWAGPNHINH